MKIIAHIENHFTEKFGIPRQSMLVPEVMSTIIFEPDYRNPDALRGLEGYDYIWLLWRFNNADSDDWSPTVRPPKLGGNTRMGVFATRSPFRPNNIGLSCVKIIEIGHDRRGPYIIVAGADMKNGTLIYDIKPYLPYADSHPDARSGFAGEVSTKPLSISFPSELKSKLPDDIYHQVVKILSLDPRPQYHNDDRTYGMTYGKYNIKFTVINDVLTVTDIITV